MKERPILFSGPMVRALLDGRKTQTRRIIKRMDSGCVKETGGHRNWHLDDPNAIKACPYGQPGDQIWVKEAYVNLALDGYAECYVYRADGSHSDGDGIGCSLPDGLKWRPSIFCTRSASRIRLEVASVRIERLNDISEADAMAEGVNWQDFAGMANHTARKLYHRLWESINGPGSWELNPWVWAGEFKVIL